ncbi:NifU family protein [Nonomuraea sp. K274]|uniref:NifU family protein n=1 Tax=Nonomuraea cypriaca TaxID=1187855 RepID=A0A931ADC5_9ACTN|nr:NifU family protein [Nonomuraea cypriaca]MBF8187990.1 NifU family protein [Nonomuraea cypriaca]
MSERIGRIEALLETAGPAATELVKELLDLYGDGLARVMAIVGEEQGARLAADELISSLLLLHDLHPLDIRARVRTALAGGSAEVLAIEGDLVRLRVRPTGCGSSAATSALRQSVLDAAPEIERVEIEFADTSLIPVESLTVRPATTAP